MVIHLQYPIEHQRGVGSHVKERLTRWFSFYDWNLLITLIKRLRIESLNQPIQLHLTNLAKLRFEFFSRVWNSQFDPKHL